MDVALLIGIVALLIALNGLFVAAEFAMVGSSRAAIEQKARAGSRRASIVLRILSNARNQDQYVATAQLGITAASLGLGMYGEHELASYLYELSPTDGPLAWLASHAIATILAVAILTYLHIVVGEMVPKALALQHTQSTVLFVTPVMLWIRWALFPLVVGLNGIGNALLGLVGVRREVGAEQYYTPEELRLVVRESYEGGRMRGESARLLAELLEFAELRAGDVMVPRVQVVGIPAAANPEELRQVLQRGWHTRYPVYAEDLDHISGAIHIKDILKQLAEGQLRPVPAPRPVPFLPESTTLDRVLEAMHEHRTQLAVVLDEQGGTAGIITIEDLFEEVVGNLDDSGENAGDDIVVDAGERVRARGTVRLEEVGDQFGRELSHPDVETVSGLVLSLLGRPPRTGDTVTYEGLRFTVEAVAGRGVAWCEVRRIADDNDEFSVEAE